MPEIYTRQDIIQTALKLLSDLSDKFHREKKLDVKPLQTYLQKELGNVIEEIHQFESGIENQ